jgi:hypothetical protein
MTPQVSARRAGGGSRLVELLGRGPSKVLDAMARGAFER